MRTIRLNERVTSACRLSPGDVDFLLAEHRAHVDLVPTGRPGHYRLTPGGYAGTIVGPTLRLVIRPKVPLVNLIYLLDPAAVVDTVADQAAAAPGGEILDILANQLARLLAERAAAGLHRAYVERALTGPLLQGRLDLPAQLRDGGGRKDLLHSRFEDFTADVPCNQIPRATAELVLQAPFLGEETRAALRRQLAAFAEISAISLGPEHFAAAEPDPLTEAYRPLLALCRLLVEGLTSRGQTGSVPFPAFLLDMEQVFERYVTAGVRHAFQKCRQTIVLAQPLYTVNEPVPGLPDLQLRPDLVIERGGLRLLVADAKWKVPPRSAPGSTDLYQVLAYATVLGVHRAVLIYPGRRDGGWTYQLTGTPTTVEIRRLRVVGSRADCLRSWQRLGRSLRQSPGAGKKQEKK